jgi:hypothetical protein
MPATTRNFEPSSSMKKDKKEETFLTLEDFFELLDDGEPPEIIMHLITVLTGINLRPLNVSTPQDYMKVRMPTLSYQDEIEKGKEPLPYFHSKMIVNSFLAVWGRNKQDRLPGSSYEGFAVLTEQNLKQNIKHVIGYDCPYLGKMIYLLLSGGHLESKITLSKWYRFFSSFYKEEDYRQ